MAESNIRDYKAEVTGMQEELGKLVCEMDETVYLEQMREIKDALGKSHPSLMFYGIYNSGKSSLLNAIFGEEVASVNDIPETHKVTLYEWGKYILADTPGLNGPPEDEVITAAEIRKHDIIMFVIDDSDNFDSDVITKKIVEILETGKPCIIVINKKNDSDKDRVLAIKAKMNANIKTLSSVSQYFEFVDVNAKTALKAKKEHKDMLLEVSNIRELEYCISKQLASVESVQLLRVPLELITGLCKEIQNVLEKEIQDENLKSLYRLKESLFQTKEQVRQKFTIGLDRMIDGYSEEIYRQASENRQADIREEVYEQQIQEFAQSCMDVFLKESNSTLQKFTEICRMQLSLGTVPMTEDIRNVTKRINEKDDIDEVLDILEKVPIPIPAPGPVPPIPLPLVIGVIKILKKWIFGSGKEGVPDVEEWNRQQEEYAQKRSMALRELKNQISIQMEDYKGRINTAFGQQLDASYSEAVSRVDRALAETEGKNSDRVQRQEKVAEISADAEHLLQKIGM